MQTSESGILAVLLPTAFATAVAYVVYIFVFNVFFHPLAKYPGPLVARATIYWKAYTECIANRSFCHVLAELHEQYGRTPYGPLHRSALTCIAATQETLFV